VKRVELLQMIPNTFSYCPSDTTRPSNILASDEVTSSMVQRADLVGSNLRYRRSTRLPSPLSSRRNILDECPREDIR